MLRPAGASYMDQRSKARKVEGVVFEDRCGARARQTAGNSPSAHGVEFKPHDPTAMRTCARRDFLLHLIVFKRPTWLAAAKTNLSSV